MGHIVDIRSAGGTRASRASRPAPAGSADILLFTGIRYERWDDAPRRTAAPVPRPPRDRLELED